MALELQSVRVMEVVHENDTILSLYLEPLTGALLPAFTPGAHIDLHLPNGLVRSYSLMNAPHDTGVYRLGILLDRHSRGGSAFIHRYLRKGVALKVSKPRNNFPVLKASRAAFIAGGIGITPLIGMARQLQAEGAQVQMLYCSRSASDMAFQDEVAEAVRDVLVHFDDVQGGAPDLSAFLQSCPNDTHVYCCGPAPMLSALDQVCAALGLRHVHTERFAGAEGSPTGGSGFSVVLSRSGQTLHHDGQRSIVDTLLEAGHSVSYSCKEGVCGACETVVLEGEPDHRDFVLSASERQSGKTMMICVSGCKSPSLVLDL